MPSSSTAPPVTSCSRGSKVMAVDFPAPEGPTSATVCPGSAVSERPVSAASMGNPHCVLFVVDAEKAPVEKLGPVIEHHPWFPARTNVEFASLIGPNRLRQRTWERGVGVTLACGTGACAVAVSAARKGLTGRKVEVVLDGGSLFIDWRESDGHVIMTGPSTLVYRGQVDLTKLA